MANQFDYSYVITNALPGGIALAMGANGGVFTNSGLQNQHVWTFNLLNSGLISISSGQSATTAGNGFVSGTGSGPGWNITRVISHGYVAHTIKESRATNPRYWVLNPNRLGPGSQIELQAKPPGAPDLYPAALWVFTSIAKIK